MGKYKFKCDYCNKKFLNSKVYKRQHRESYGHRKNLFSYYQNKISCQLLNNFLIFNQHFLLFRQSTE